MGNNEGPVTVQEVRDRLKWLVTTHILTDAEKEQLPRPVEPIQGPLREGLTRMQEFLARFPPPTAAEILAVLRDFPVAVERGREHGYAAAATEILGGDAKATDDGSAWFSMDTSELRVHFGESTVAAVAACYERGWLEGWREYCDTRNQSRPT